MTPKQRIQLMSALWPAAARANGWDIQDRAQRLAIINQVLAQHPQTNRRRTVESANELDTNTDYTLVKNRFLMLADSLQGAREDGDLTANAIRQRREVIRRLIKQLADHLAISSPHPTKADEPWPSTAADESGIPPSHPLRIERAERYTLKIIHDTTARAGIEPECFVRATFEQVLSSLDLLQLNHLIITLKKRISRKRPAPRDAA
jgi:hypothetical protein